MGSEREFGETANWRRLELFDLPGMAGIRIPALSGRSEAATGDDSLPGLWSLVSPSAPNRGNPIKPGGAYRFSLRARKETHRRKGLSPALLPIATAPPEPLRTSVSWNSVPVPAVMSGTLDITNGDLHHFLDTVVIWPPYWTGQPAPEIARRN